MRFMISRATTLPTWDVVALPDHRRCPAIRAFAGAHARHVLDQTVLREREFILPDYWHLAQGNMGMG